MGVGMTEKKYQAGLRPAFYIAVLSVIFCAGSAWAQQRNYLQDDAKISGDQINTFTDNGEMVSVIVGNFTLDVGKQSVSGKDAVIWIKTQENGPASKHDITVYVEGNAHVIEPNSSTQDEMMLVKLHVQGRLSMAGNVSTKSLKDFPLYVRAGKIRTDEAQMTRSWRTRASKNGQENISEPALVVRKSADEEDINNQKEKSEDDDVVRLEKLSTPTDSPNNNAPERLSDAADSQPIEKKAPEAQRQLGPQEGRDTPPTEITTVHVEATGGITGEKDPDNPNRRILLTKDKIYISMGTAKSKDHIELRADYAVIFTRKDLPQEDSDEKVPYAPPVVGLPDTGERITGVYLEGDVIMTRGPRKITGEALYYDFVEQNALILKPVLRTIQEQRNIPIYVRGDKAKVHGMRETEFYNAVVSTSDFKTPTYQFGAKRVRVRDETPYDDEGEKLSEQRMTGEYEQGVGAIRGVPMFWSPKGKFSWEEGHSALRKLQPVFGGQRDYGVETEWQLFRLLGIVKPEGFSATLTASGYKKAALVGVDMDYERREGNRQYSGYGLAYGMWDEQSKVQFGDENVQPINRPERGRLLLRHKEFLPKDWQIQAELSLISDRAYLEEFFSDEYWAGKEQENLIYAKKQRDNWAITALLKTKLNYFETQTESYPDISAYLIGQPVLGNRLTYFGEARMGAKRLDVSNSDTKHWKNRGWTFTGKNADSLNDLYTDSDVTGRFDTRHEIDLPLSPMTPIGPVNVVPYAVGRLSVWTDSPGDNNAKVRPYAQFGVRSNMHFWRIYNNAESRLLDVHKLKHIITPEANFFTSFDGGVQATDLYQFDQNVEGFSHNTGAQFAIYQRLQTKRGPVGNQQTVDWMRFNVQAGIFDRHNFETIDEDGNISVFTGDGRYFFSRPEYSLARNYVSADYLWNISDSTAFMADIKWDLDDGHCDLWNVGFAVERSPRLSYYMGMRYINELDSNALTFGAKYKINKKYSVSFFEQYDFRTNGGQNLGSRLSIVRRFPRWNVGLTLLYDQRYSENDEFGAMISIWHAGIPEAFMSTGTMKLLNQSDKN